MNHKQEQKEPKELQPMPSNIEHHVAKQAPPPIN